MSIRTQSQQIASRMIERERECGGKIARPYRRAACRKANKTLGYVCFDIDALSEMDAEIVMAIARSTGHIGDS